VPPQISKRSWAQDNLGYPDVTGSVPAAKPEPPAAASATPSSPGKPNGSGDGKSGAAVASGPIDPEKATVPAGERAVLERLGERRQELETQARELEIREGLLKAAEAKLEARLAELAELESRINSVSGKKSEAEAARFKGLVSMYENMKAKDAAKIFDRLDLKILVDVATQMNPRRMSDVLAQMSPEAAERLTVELAGKPALAGAKPAPLAELPKIEGKPRM
jgi:flagellar motility protein MotE (MotC chaperone)